MEYWQNVLGDRILHIQYEDLINDQEGVSRQLVKHAGLEWDAKCLQFYETGGQSRPWASGRSDSKFIPALLIAGGTINPGLVP